MRGTTDPALFKRVMRLADKLLAEGRVLATAESCTGGWLAKCLTDVPGSSAWFDRGWVTYSDRAKRQELGVSSRLLNRHGAVSEAVVRAMARGALRGSVADTAVAITGIAGPDGGSEDKPVGTVWIAWARRDGDKLRVQVRHFLFGGAREVVRRKTLAATLEGLLTG